MCVHRKAQLALFFILVIAAGLLIVLMMLKGLHASTILDVKKTVSLSSDLSDKGTGTFAIMNSEYNGKKYIQILGESLADNYASQPHLEYFALKDTISKLGNEFYFQFCEKSLDSGSPLLGTGELPDIEELKEIKEIRTAGTSPASTGTENKRCGHEHVDLGVQLIWPLDGLIDGFRRRVTSGFGYRDVPRPCYCHSGVDMSNKIKEKIKAVYGGTVIRTVSHCVDPGNCWENFIPSLCKCNGGFGNLVTIEHESPNGMKFYTHYIHLSAVSVKKGQTVKAGEYIGVMGNTGNSQAMHLHFELALDNSLSDNSALNPCPFFIDPGDGCEKPAIESCYATASSSTFDADIPIPGASSIVKGGVMVVKRI
jgi:hypothetical protein